MRASTIVYTLVALVASANAIPNEMTSTEVVPTGTSATVTATLEPSLHPSPSANTTGSHNVTQTATPPPSDGAGAALSPAGALGFAIAGVAVMVGGALF